MKPYSRFCGLLLVSLLFPAFTFHPLTARAQDTPATFNSGPVVWNEGGSATFVIDKADGTSGVNWSRNNINGTLTFSSGYTAASTFTLNIESVIYGGDGMDTGAPGATTNFDPSKDYTWTFVHTTGGVVGFDVAKVTLDSSQFKSYNSIQSGPNNQNGAFVLALLNGGNDLAINFVNAGELPEPGTGTLAILPLLVACGAAFASKQQRHPEIRRLVRQ